MQVGIAASALAVLLDQAKRSFPEEACGILLGDEKQISKAQPTANVALDRARHFEIDPQALIAAYRDERSGGPKVIGFYHSHPNGKAAPSATDRALASGDGRVWAIVAGEEVTFWHDLPSGFMRLSYTVNDR